MKRAALYARVSTKKDEQQNALGAAIDRLRDYAERRGFSHRVFSDTLTGSRIDREQYQSMRDAVRKREVDVVVSTKLDRLGRSLKELMSLFEEAQHVGVEVVVLDQAIDTGTPTGVLVLHILGAVAQFERELIKDRIARGLDTARRRGHRLGRPQAHADLVPRAIQLKAGGASWRAVAKELGVPASWVRRNVSPSRVAGTEGSIDCAEPMPDRPVSDPPGGSAP